MSTFKTVTGYALALIVVLALVVGACGIDNSDRVPMNAMEFDRASEAENDVDDLDEYDTDQLLEQYNLALSYVDELYASDPMACADYRRNPLGHLRDFAEGFKITAPDEIWYIVTDVQLMKDVETIIAPVCEAGA